MYGRLQHRAAAGVPRCVVSATVQPQSSRNGKVPRAWRCCAAARERQAGGHYGAWRASGQAAAAAAPPSRVHAQARRQVAKALETGARRFLHHFRLRARGALVDREAAGGAAGAGAEDRVQAAVGRLHESERHRRRALGVSCGRGSAAASVDTARTNSISARFSTTSSSVYKHYALLGKHTYTPQSQRCAPPAAPRCRSLQSPAASCCRRRAAPPRCRCRLRPLLQRGRLCKWCTACDDVLNGGAAALLQRCTQASDLHAASMHRMGVHARLLHARLTPTHLPGRA